MRTENRHLKAEHRVCPWGGMCPQSPVKSPSRSTIGKRKRLQVLMYHRVCPDSQAVTSRFVVSKDTFRKQMEFLALHGFCTPTISNILLGATENCNAGKQPIIITFDDGYLDTYENAFPILKEFGLSPIVFVIADFSRSVNSWDKDGALCNAPLLRPYHIRIMSESGIQFGVHSLTHSSLPSLNDAELDQELCLSRTALKGVIRQTFPILAYPYGDVNERVKNAGKRAGYRCAFSAHSGPLKYSSDLFEIRRIFMTNRTSRIYLMYKASGLDHVFRWGVWRLKRLFVSGSRIKTPNINQNR